MCAIGERSDGPFAARYLVIGHGGHGAGSSTTPSAGGGGGGGGFKAGTDLIITAPIAITVDTVLGGTSSIGTFAVVHSGGNGGGGAVFSGGGSGSDGASGGGGGSPDGDHGSAIHGAEGHDGADGGPGLGGGGGGSGSPGFPGSTTGQGGSETLNDITGTNVTYCSGGDSGGTTLLPPGNGGAGGFNGSGGQAGQPGIVMIRYPGIPRATGGTITSVGTDTLHTFTANGTLTPL